MAQTGQEIVNPRTGQRMIFRRTARDTNGALLQIESFNPPHGPAEPEHVHVRQESRAKVLSGTLHFRVRDRVRVVGQGQEIVIPLNTPHNFWNEGDEEAHTLQEFRPALRIEDFFVNLFGLAADGKLDERGMPSLMQIAVMSPAFGDEIRPTSPPWALIRVISWVLGPIARRRGYQSVYPKYMHPAAGISTPERGAPATAQAKASSLG